MSTGMNAVISDWSVYSTQFDIMHQRLSGDNEKEAIAMREQIAQSIVDAYLNDGDDNTNITLETAKAYVDTAYQQRTGQSIVATIEQTTQSGWLSRVLGTDSDNLTAEDLYKMMEGENPNTEGADSLGEGIVQTGKTSGAGAVIGGIIGGVIGLFGGPGGVVAGAALGAKIGGGIGFVTGLLDSIF